jgi:arylsulfate sulfotransferase
MTWATRNLLGSGRLNFSALLGTFLVLVVAHNGATSNLPGTPPASNLEGLDVGDTLPPTFLGAPQFTLAPNPSTSLVGLLELGSDEPTQVHLVISEGSRSWPIVFNDFNTAHALPVLGLRPGKEHTISVMLVDEAGNMTTWETPIHATTAPLPDGFPSFIVSSQPEKMEPGITLFTITGIGPNAGADAYIVAVDERGEIVWLNHGLAFDVRKNAAGNLLLIQAYHIVEMDMLGNRLRVWGSAADPGGLDAILIPTHAFHHEVFEMNNGNLLALSVEQRPFDTYPSSTTDPDALTETANVAGDVIVEFTPEGEVVHEWKLLDMLDPYRLGYLSLNEFWNLLFPEATNGTRDWSHGNGVIHDPFDDSIIVSLRHQDAVVKFSRTDSRLVWILGPHENWSTERFGDYLLSPVNPEPFFWQYHQHAPMVLPNGNLLLFDNGNYRSSPFNPPLPDNENFSRAVEYRIDEENLTVEKVWEYGQFSEEILYAGFVGDADWQPNTGNVLITFGGIQAEDGIRARLIEVTYEDPAEVVFDLAVDVPYFYIYRSERYPSLYFSSRCAMCPRE